MMSAIGSTAPHTPCKAALEAPTIYVSAGVTGVTVVGVRGRLDAEPSAEDAEVLQSLMSTGSQSALEFLG
jgi:hypothetical protein